MISGPPLTRSILEQLQAIAQRAEAGEITPQQAVAEASQIDPRLGGLIERFTLVGLSAVAALCALIGLYLQDAQYELQKADSEISADFYDRALKLFEDQVALQERAEQARYVERLEQQKIDKRIERKSRAPSMEKIKREAPTFKDLSKRRSDVNKKRRDELKRRRMMFTPR